MKAAIFDLDNTLLDSEPLWNALPSLLLARYEKKAEADLFQQVASMSLEEAVDYIRLRYHLPSTTKAMLGECFSIITDAYVNTLPLFPHALEALKLLHEKGIAICVATASPLKLAMGALKRTGAMDYLQFVLTEEEVGKSKREPDIYLKAAEKLHAQPMDCMVFEDAPHAIETALKAQFPVCGVFVSDFKKATEGCTTFIRSFEEIVGGKLCTLL